MSCFERDSGDFVGTFTFGEVPTGVHAIVTAGSRGTTGNLLEFGSLGAFRGPNTGRLPATCAELPRSRQQRRSQAEQGIISARTGILRELTGRRLPPPPRGEP